MNCFTRVLKNGKKVIRSHKKDDKIVEYRIVITIFLFFSFGTILSEEKPKRSSFFKKGIGSFQIGLGSIMTLYSLREIAKSIKEKLPVTALIDKRCYDFLGAFFGVNIMHVGWQRITNKEYSAYFFTFQKPLCDPITLYHAKSITFTIAGYAINAVIKRLNTLSIDYYCK